VLLPGRVVFKGVAEMYRVPKVICRAHHIEYIVGSTVHINGESPRRHLRCPEEGCAVAAGKFCSRCRELIRTERRPEHDHGTHDGRAEAMIVAF